MTRDCKFDIDENPELLHQLATQNPYYKPYPPGQHKKFPQGFPTASGSDTDPIKPDDSISVAGRRGQHTPPRVRIKMGCYHQQTPTGLPSIVESATSSPSGLDPYSPRVTPDPSSALFNTGKLKARFNRIAPPLESRHPVPLHTSNTPNAHPTHPGQGTSISFASKPALKARFERSKPPHDPISSTTLHNGYPYHPMYIPIPNSAQMPTGHSPVRSPHFRR